MLRWLMSLLLVLTAASLMVTSVVHAREAQASVSIECTGVVHADDDRDRAGPDGDQAVPHHHGTCHGQALDLASVYALMPRAAFAGQRLDRARDAALPSRALDPALRPPAA